MPLRHYIPIFILFILSGCFEEPEYADEPEIEFVSVGAFSFAETQEDIRLIISFQDGDGDLGINKNTGEPDEENTDFDEFLVDENGDFILDDDGEKIVNKFRNNYFVNVYKEVDGVFQLQEFPEGQDYNGVFPRLSDSENDKALEGEIEYTFELFLGTGFASPIDRGDIVKFEIQIADRSLNLSNIVESNPIVIGNNGN